MLFIFTAHSAACRTRRAVHDVFDRQLALIGVAPLRCDLNPSALRHEHIGQIHTDVTPVRVSEEEAMSTLGYARHVCARPHLDRPFAMSESIELRKAVRNRL
jgi:hypothetical protein